MEKHPKFRLPGMEMFFEPFPDVIDVGAADRYDKNGFGSRPTINLFCQKRHIPMVLKLVSCMEQKHHVPRVYLVPPQPSEDQANVSVFFTVPLSRELSIELFKPDQNRVRPDDYFKVIVSGESEIEPENADEFLELYGQLGYFFVDISSRSVGGQELLWTKQLTL